MPTPSDAYGIRKIASWLMTRMLAGADPATLMPELERRLLALDVGQAVAKAVPFESSLAIGYSPQATADRMLLETAYKVGKIKVDTPGRRAQAVNTLLGVDKRIAGMVEDIGHATTEQRKVYERRPDEYVVWIAERNACPRCLDLAGSIYSPAGGFAGEGWLGPPVVAPHPPAHPNCRCTVKRIKIDVAEDYVTGLRREAARSIALGHTDFASKRQMIELADRVATKAPYLPKRVLDRAKRAAKTGEFPARPTH